MDKDKEVIKIRYKGVNAMTKLDKVNITGLTKEKKAILKNSIGKCTSKIDLNKVRDEWKKCK